MADAKRIRLDEVTLMRTILALLIVFMHAFTCYQGAWPQPESYVDIPLYKWIAQTSFAFTLEAFVFISGYLFSFTRNYLNRKESFVTLARNKLKRLILPSIIFGTFYFLFFFQYNGVQDAIYSIIGGCGHMWFLPMLFWCFLATWLIEQINISHWWKLLFLFCLHVFMVIPIPLRVDTACSFLFYFYAGYVLFLKRDRILSSLSIKYIVLFWFVFIIIFFLLRPLKDSFSIEGNYTLIYKGLTHMGQSFIQLVYASIGTFVFFITAYYYTKNHTLKQGTVNLAGYCFGIYLFQQFVLQFFYYKTSLPAIVGPYWLPWLGFLIALPISYLLTFCLLKTRVGRFLI